ncbi:hypothetical protein [Nocardia tengchongensis]
MHKPEDWSGIRDEEARIWEGIEPFIDGLRVEVHAWAAVISRLAEERRSSYPGNTSEQLVQLDLCSRWLRDVQPEWKHSICGLTPTYPPDLGQHSVHSLLSYEDWDIEEIDVRELEMRFDELLTFLEEFIENRPLFHSRGEYYPDSAPRYARLRDGISFKHFSDDLLRSINLGETVKDVLRLKISPGSRTHTDPRGRIDGTQGHAFVEHLVGHWVEPAAQLLRGIQISEYSPDFKRNPPDDFRRTVQGWMAYKNPFTVNPLTLAKTFIGFGTDYLREVQKNMPDYLESSGINPTSQYSINIHGSTINGPVAMKLDAINSTIAGILNQGSADLGKALETLKEAILTDTTDDPELRQDLLDNLETVAGATQSPPASRDRAGLKAILKVFKTAALSGPEVAKAMEAWGHVLAGLTA